MNTSEKPNAATRFVKRPQEVEAIQFVGTPESCAAVTEFLGGTYSQGHTWNVTTTIGGYLKERNGAGQWVPRSDGAFGPGCWLVRDANGKLNVYRDEDFHRIFEAVDG